MEWTVNTGCSPRRGGSRMDYEAIQVKRRTAEKDKVEWITGDDQEEKER